MPDARHDRQIRVPEVGREGQRRLAAARVLVVGVGGLGCAAALGLARTGIGALRLVDSDRVDASNLGRQVLFTEADLGRLKVEAAAGALRLHAPELDVETIPEPLTRANLAHALEGIDLVVDGTDSLAPRRLLNAAAFTAGVPVIFGGATGTSGLVLPVLPPLGPCYLCALPEPSEETCDTVGVLTPLVLLVGAMQATAAVATLLGRGEPGRLTTFDAFGGTRTLRVAPRPGCLVCTSATEVRGNAPGV